VLIDYVERQEEHHRERSFEEEFVTILKKHGVEYDERYLFDVEGEQEVKEPQRGKMS